MSRTIVVGWALDVVGRRAVELAAQLSRGGRLYLVHVAAPDPDFVPWEAGPAGERDRIATELRGEHRALQGLAEELRAQGVEVTALLVQGPTAAVLVDEAHRRQAGLLVIGTHGRRGLARLILGSVAEEVLRCADLPVVVVPLERS
jgi:nucleotide-binding universal stress UspA family protein